MNDMFNNLIHVPNRLRICALLLKVSELEFKTLKMELDLSDSSLSKHLKALEEADYIKVAKRNKLGRPRSWVSLTNTGIEAFNTHIFALKKMVE